MLETGRIVHSVAGHDKDRFYVVVRSTAEAVWIADGKRRRLEKPKRKNPKHVAATRQSLDLTAVNTDKKLRQALGPLNNRPPSASTLEEEAESLVQGRRY